MQLGRYDVCNAATKSCEHPLLCAFCAGMQLHTRQQLGPEGVWGGGERRERRERWALRGRWGFGHALEPNRYFTVRAAYMLQKIQAGWKAGACLAGENVAASAPLPADLADFM